MIGTAQDVFIMSQEKRYNIKIKTIGKMRTVLKILITYRENHALFPSSRNIFENVFKQLERSFE